MIITSNAIAHRGSVAFFGPDAVHDAEIAMQFLPAESARTCGTTTHSEGTHRHRNDRAYAQQRVGVEHVNIEQAILSQLGKLLLGAQNGPRILDLPVHEARRSVSLAVGAHIAPLLSRACNVVHR